MDNLNNEEYKMDLKEQFSPHLKIVLNKMCEAVGANYNSIDFKEEGWFKKYSWTEQEENKFKEWLVDYLKDKRSRFELFNTVFYNKKEQRIKLANSFVFNFGWKYKI